MLGLTFTKYSFSINSEGEGVEVCEFEIDNFNERKITYRLTVKCKLYGIVYILERKRDIWGKIMKEELDYDKFNRNIESILPRNRDTEDLFVTAYEFEIAKTFWIEGRKHAQEEIAREKVQTKKEKKETKKNRIF